MTRRRQKRAGQPAHLEAVGRRELEGNDEALREALRKLEADPTLPATQEMVATLAGVTRGTFNNRKKRVGPDGKVQDDPAGLHAWFKRIKASRKAPGAARVRKPEDELRQELTELKAKAADLEGRLKLARAESKRQYHKRVDIERKYNKLTSRFTTQSALLGQATDKLAALKGNPGSVVMLRPDEPL